MHGKGFSLLATFRSSGVPGRSGALGWGVSGRVNSGRATSRSPIPELSLDVIDRDGKARRQVLTSEAGENPETLEGTRGHPVATPDQRLRVFISSSLDELALEREAAANAVRSMGLTPVMFEQGARPYPADEVYRSYVRQSDVFIGIYWQSYGWTAEGRGVSGIADDYSQSQGMPRLIYLKTPAPERDPSLASLIDRMMSSGDRIREFATRDELAEMLLDDLALVVTDRVDGVTEPNELPSGTLTFLFADLEDSTPLLQQLGEAYATLLRRYHSIVNSATAGHEGKTVSTEGDGLFCVFASAGAAVEAAHQIQLEMTSSPWPREARPRCRIGLHTGSALRTLEGYVGIDIHRAARIGAAAHGGQILISSATRNLVEDLASRSGWRIADLGPFILKGINRSERLHRLDLPDAPLVILPPRARPYIPSSVPAPARPIIGRRTDVIGASEMLLRESVRLVTVTGPGGTGKTRLAIELARRLEPDFPGGVVFLDLSAIREADRFLPALGRAFGVQEAKGRTIVDALGSVVGAAKVLLILDNMEQLLEAGPEVIPVLTAVPNLKILVTSRSPLRLSWEHEYPLLPLSVPPTTANAVSIRASEAVTLLVERAQAVRPGFDLTPSNLPVVAEITRRLDGLPLAIELAAARLRLFTPEVLLERLDRRLTILDRGAADSPERHRTLRGAIQWSHDLLDDLEKVVFRRLSVFAGGFTLEAVLAVCLGEGLSESEVLDQLEELVAKSLVVFSIDDDGAPRYRMLETLREFSLERLTESGEEDGLRRRHLRWCLDVASRLEVALPTPEFPALLDEVDRERLNLREALAWSVRTSNDIDDALWICGLLPLYWDIRGYVTEGLDWMGRLLALAEPGTDTRGRALALGAVGWLAMIAGDPERSELALTASDEMWRRLGDEKWLARSLSLHGMTTYNLNEIDRAEAQLVEATNMARKLGDEWVADGWCVYGLAHIALARNDFLTTDRLLRQALEYSETRGLTWGVGHAQLSLGVLAFMTGDIPQAEARLSQSLLVRRQLKDSRGICDCLGVMALLASVQGAHERAATLLGAADVRREATGQMAVPWQQPLLEQAAISARQALGHRYDEFFTAGRTLAADQAIQLAIDHPSPLPRAAEPVGSS